MTHMLVYGDSYVEGIGADSEASGFAPLAAAKLGWSVQLFGKGGTGYVKPGPRHNKTYLLRLDELVVEEKPDLVLLQGGLNDQKLPGITPAAVTLIGTLRHRFPAATLVLLGPVDPWPSRLRPSGVPEVARQLAAAALQVGAPFIDAAEWITKDDRKRFGAGDRLHLNQAGHEHVAIRLVEALSDLGI